MDLINQNNLMSRQRVKILLPVAQFIVKGNPVIEKWVSGIARDSNSSLAIPIKPEGSSCVNDQWNIRVIQTSHLQPGSNGMAWRRYREMLKQYSEFLVVDTTSVEGIEFSNLQGRTFAYFSPDINRTLTENDRFEIDGAGKLNFIRAARLEQELEFYFPAESTGIRWGNCWMVVLICVDVFMGPLAWLLTFTPIITGRP